MSNLRQGTTGLAGTVWWRYLMPDVDAVLFDLDDTLLGNDMDQFLKAYFPLVAEYVQPIIEGDSFLADLMIGTQAMIANQDPDLTNREVFWSVFCQRTGLDQEYMEDIIEGFYRDRFGALKEFTTCRPAAKNIVQLCLDRDILVIVATNPLFPRIAIEQRLEWAGVSVEDFSFSLITSYENMHFAKPHVSYYQEILREFDLSAERTLMVGDDWENDMVPADQLGCKTYWIVDDGASQPGISPKYQGSLDKLFDKFRAGWLIS